jgi:predicted amidohydrolase YtcJ
MRMDRTFADTVFCNGRIYTSNRQQPWVTCTAVKAGRFVTVGNDADVASLIGEGTTTIDLGGRMAMPGIVDIHNHIMIGGQADLYELRFSSSDSIPKIADAVHKAASEAAPDAWIVAASSATIC